MILTHSKHARNKKYSTWIEYEQVLQSHWQSDHPSLPCYVLRESLQCCPLCACRFKGLWAGVKCFTCWSQHSLAPGAVLTKLFLFLSYLFIYLFTYFSCFLHLAKIMCLAISFLFIIQIKCFSNSNEFTFKHPSECGVINISAYFNSLLSFILFWMARFS